MESGFAKKLIEMYRLWLSVSFAQWEEDANQLIFIRLIGIVCQILLYIISIMYDRHAQLALMTYAVSFDDRRSCWSHHVPNLALADSKPEEKPCTLAMDGKMYASWLPGDPPLETRTTIGRFQLHP